MLSASLPRALPRSHRSSFTLRPRELSDRDAAASDSADAPGPWTAASPLLPPAAPFLRDYGRQKVSRCPGDHK